MCFLEANNIQHCDLAARNVLVHGNSLKITDFGLARRGGNEYMKPMERPETRHAPETFRLPACILRSGAIMYPNPIYTSKSDGLYNRNA